MVQARDGDDEVEARVAEVVRENIVVHQMCVRAVRETPARLFDHRPGTIDADDVVEAFREPREERRVTAADLEGVLPLRRERAQQQIVVAVFRVAVRYEP